MVKNPTNNYQYLSMQMIPRSSSNNSIKFFLYIIIAIIFAEIFITIYIVIKKKKNVIEVTGTYFGYQGGLKSESDNKAADTLMSQISF